MQRRAQLLLLPLLLAAAAAPLAAAEDDPCHGRGVPSPQGTCICNNDFPEPGAEQGWTGPTCLIPVYPGVADGSDMAAGCRAAGCATLQPNGWVCFAVHANFSDPSWSYLSVLLNRTSADERGDPDLFGLWAGGERAAVPNTNATGFDFQDTSAASHATITKLVRKADFADAVPGQAPPGYDGAYLCVRSYGGAEPMEFSLQASLTPCPSSYGPVGEPLQCSTPRAAPEGERRYSECSAAGECVCTGQWAKPVPSVFPGLGYEDCSTPTLDVSRDTLAAQRSVQLEGEQVQPGSWRQYRFEVGENDTEVVVNLQVQDTNTTGWVDLFLKPEQPAGSGARQFDVRPRWNAATRDSSLEVVLNPGLPQWRAGVWFAGVICADAAVTYDLSFSLFDCPGNCSAHGACVPTGGDAPPQSHECRCEEGYGGPDCAKATKELEYGVAVGQPASAFELHYYSLPEPTEAMLAGNVELVVQASFNSSFMRHALEAHPSVLLGQGNGSTYPSPSSFAHKLPLDQPGVAYNTSLCPSQVRQSGGQWLLAFYNPMPTMPLAYSLAVIKIGRCLHSCSDHGSCNSDGVCECTAEWAGGDCSVPLTNTTCLAGTRRAAPRPDDHGTCWQECKCGDGGKECSFTDGCAGFSCEEGYRRRGEAPQCVKDACTKDSFTADAAAVCLRNCTCPADGGPCALDLKCSVHIDIAPRRGGASGGTVFFWMVVALLLGGGGAMGWVHMYGVPPWLPIRERGYQLGLYNELSEHGGI